MKRYSKMNCKYALVISKFIGDEYEKYMNDEDHRRFDKLLGTENNWRTGKASDSPIVSGKWFGEGVL